jgi:CRISPR-associated protein Cmr3
MFKHLIVIQPLGMLYGSAGAFLSPENLVGRSGAKFPPDSATLSGLFFSANYHNEETKKELKEKLFIAGAFWADIKEPDKIYVPIPWHRIISKEKNAYDEWEIKTEKDKLIWSRDETKKDKDIEPDFTWFPLDDWENQTKTIHRNQSAKEAPWEFNSVLHPKMAKSDRSSAGENSLFLENAVQMRQDSCLVYLSTHTLEDAWYRFGGENHLVEITSQPIKKESKLWEILNQPIEKAFALITPAIWGSTRISKRYPEHQDFPKVELMLTDKAIPTRYSAGGRLGRGRYAVSAGSVYVLEHSLNQKWWDFPKDWFPNEGISLKHFGCGLCLPIKIKGL